MCKALAICSLLYALASTSVHADVIRGRVSGWDNSTLSTARITAVNSDSSVVLEARSGLDGTYRFEGVPPGSWLLGASHVSYAYRETLRTVGTAEVVQDFQLGPNNHPGRWTTIGNTDPENLYATNFGLPAGRWTNLLLSQYHRSGAVRSRQRHQVVPAGLQLHSGLPHPHADGGRASAVYWRTGHGGFPRCDSYGQGVRSLERHVGGVAAAE